MPSPLNITVTTSGPLWTGAIQHGLQDVVEAAKEEIATQGANHLRDDLGVPPFKNPTGWYRSHVTQKLLGTVWAIQDSGVIYGPWLAGVSARNRTTRFKGYAHWRRALVFVSKIAKPVLEKEISRYLARFR